LRAAAVITKTRGTLSRSAGPAAINAYHETGLESIVRISQHEIE